MKIEDAKRLYAIGGESKDIALEYFPELKERQLPKTWEEYQENFNKVGDERFAWTSGQVPFSAYTAFRSLAKLYMLKQEYNGGETCPPKEMMNWHTVTVDYGEGMKMESYFLLFKTADLARQFNTNFADLIEAAKPLLG